MIGTTKSSVYQAAEKTILDVSKFAFIRASSSIAASTVQTTRSALDGSSSSCSPNVLVFFLKILHRHSTDSTKSKLSLNAANATQVKRQPSSSGGLSSLSDSNMTPSLLELQFALKAINYALLGEGDLDRTRHLITW